MLNGSTRLLIGGAVGWAVTLLWLQPRPDAAVPSGRSEVIFWHFWGGADRAVVEEVVRRFNQSQEHYWVRAIAAPGNNLDAKLFLSVAGGHPPDLVNQDDPVAADWFERGVIVPVDEYAGSAAASELDDSLLPAAQRLGRYAGRWIAVPNGLDVRALYFNRTVLDQYGLQFPRTLNELDDIARTLSPPGAASAESSWFAFLPDARRLWTWGFVFGGRFQDAEGCVTLATPPLIAAARWMAQYSRWYGADVVSRFRHGDQSLPGKRFPLLPREDRENVGRYALVLDGQWRVRDIEEFQKERRARGATPVEFGVCPLPYPPQGQPRAGWVNGNLFLVPRGARNPAGAWAFIRFWIGLDDPRSAAETCWRGGWIPVAQRVVDEPFFQAEAASHPLFRVFVDLASDGDLHPYPATPGAMYFRRTVDQAMERLLHHPELDAADVLRRAEQETQRFLDRRLRRNASPERGRGGRSAAPGEEARR